MKITKNYDYAGFQNYTVISNDSEYDVNCLDGNWACNCAIKYNRRYGSDCKHIKEVKE